jgi:hypothetical protein
MDRVNEKSIHRGKNMTDQSLSPARLEEMAVSAREWAIQRGTVENYPATARAHIRELADALLSKTRTPVAEDSLAVQALKSAQNNIAARRPPGSSDPQSPRYDHDAFLWDYYQRAIDSLALASAPVADGITPAGMKEICPACGHQFACFHNPYIDELRAALASVPVAKPKRAPLDDWRVQAIAECLEAEWDEMSPDLAEANARIIVGYLIEYENESAQIEAANAEGSLEPVVLAVRNLRAAVPEAGEALDDDIRRIAQMPECHHGGDFAHSVDPIPFARALLAHYSPAKSREAYELRLAIKTCGSKVFKALAAIANVHTPDDLDRLGAIPRSPVLDEVVRIRQAIDECGNASSPRRDERSS